MKRANRYDDTFEFEMQDYQLDLQNEQDELDAAICIWQEADYARYEAEREERMEHDATDLWDEWAQLMDELDYYRQRLAA